MSYVATWYESYCPKCQAENFVDGGEVNDPSGPDPEGIKCWKCGYCFILGDEDEQEFEESSCDDGKHLIDAKLFLEAIELVESFKLSSQNRSSTKKKVKELKRKAGLEEGKK